MDARRAAERGWALVHESEDWSLIAKMAASEGLVGLQEVDLPGPNWPEGKNGSHWIALARTRADLGRLVDDPRWTPLVASPSTPLWTDDFSNILSVLDLR